MEATGDYVGVQDADMEYDPADYITMLEPLLDGRADVVYGSRYLLPDTRRVLRWWHTRMNKSLTTLSNMFTNLDITDMETCYKLFRREVIQDLAPRLRENRFGFEPEVTALVARGGYRVYECAIHYSPRTAEEGKKINWKDGVRALYCIMHYSASTAPLPMQILLHFFIGMICAVCNVTAFLLLRKCAIGAGTSIPVAFAFSALVNYFLCVSFLFRHKSYWGIVGEIVVYLVTMGMLGCLDYYLTRHLISIGMGEGRAKTLVAAIGFLGNFILHRVLIFPERTKDKKGR